MRLSPLTPEFLLGANKNLIVKSDLSGEKKRTQYNNEPFLII